MYDYSGDEVDSELITYGTFGDYTVGYKVYESSFSDYFYVYLYTSTTNEAGVEVYENTVKVFELYDYTGDVPQEDLVKAILDNLVLYEEEK